MNARNMFKALALAATLASSTFLGGCMHRTIIEEQVAQDEEGSGPASAATSEENAIANHPLYVRSGETQPGEQQMGPQPEPWHQRLGPQPEPWHREGKDDGRSPPPPNDPSPSPDPNPKP